MKIKKRTSHMVGWDGARRLSFSQPPTATVRGAQKGKAPLGAARCKAVGMRQRDPVLLLPDVVR